jgi:GR25 family glycosyltransferase involved in LPS biosynthesis
LGCLLSHLWCLTNIINNKFKNAIIFEDDVIFHKNFLNMFSSIYSENLDLLLLGACDFNFESVHQYLVKNNKYTIDENSKKVYGSHANYYSLKGAKKMLNLHLNNPIISFFDKLYPQLFEYFNKFQSSFICYPNLVISDISTSNLNHNYSYFSISETNYYKKCFVNINFKDYHYFNLCLLEKKYEINPNETIESYINRILYSLFYNQEKIDIIKNRLSFNFFSCEDLKYIMNL